MSSLRDHDTFPEVSMHSASPSRSPGAELALLVHGPCDPVFLASLGELLTPERVPAAPGPERIGTRVARRQSQLGRGLPTARELFEDPARLAALHAWAMAADPALCMASLVHYLLCLGSMLHLAAEPEGIKAHVQALESGRARGSYMITEVGQATSHLDVRTRAEFDPAAREFVLHTPDAAASKFAGVGTPGVVHTAVVLARLFVDRADCGVFAFVVDISDADGPLTGVELSQRIELSELPLDYTQVRFHHLRLPYERWLRDSAHISDEGTFHDPLGSVDVRLQRTLCVGQDLWGTVPSAAAAATRQSAVLALSYARRRVSQGRLAPGIPLLEYRTQQRALLGALADAFALTCAADAARTLWAASLAPAGTATATDPAATDDLGTAMGFGPWAAVSRPLAGYKALAVREAARITAECQRRCGLSGHLDLNRMTAYHGFFHAFDAAGGDSQLILYDLGRALVEEGVGEGGVEAVAPAVRGASSDPAWWAGVTRAHEHTLVGRLRRLRDGRSANGAEAFEVWNPLLEQAGELGEAYTRRLAADDVARTVAAVVDPQLATALRLLACLHGVVAAGRSAASLLAVGTLRPEDVQELSALVDRLCDDLLPHLPLIEEAFAYPAGIVPAPLAAPDYNQALADALDWHRGGTA
ncbi:acyl-CoA dehydrogenase family protein [Streptomyces sp. H27-D2]|uniref:acyl-CoA dehydrogenase family protein n=1 Tax=Streptomyces sp. H27-D2 TaxID=3046304 RepID=UPI002DB6513C|nr:acyl-CoA dehydrogenase [Streptomyces sp. H27-D2]MEC4020688.1 acyl-CoA dehydrogenase [Streptomyces sp. H27-D2]